MTPQPKPRVGVKRKYKLPGGVAVTLHPKVYAVCFPHDGKAMHSGTYTSRAHAVRVARFRNREVPIYVRSFVIEVTPGAVVWPVTPKPPGGKRGGRK